MTVLVVGFTAWTATAILIAVIAGRCASLSDRRAAAIHNHPATIHADFELWTQELSATRDVAEPVTRPRSNPPTPESGHTPNNPTK